MKNNVQKPHEPKYTGENEDTLGRMKGAINSAQKITTNSILLLPRRLAKVIQHRLRFKVMLQGQDQGADPGCRNIGTMAARRRKRGVA